MPINWETTIRSADQGKYIDPRKGSLFLLTFGTNRLMSHALPDQGELVIGRDDDAGIRISEPSISRRHAILRLGNMITVEDLGSLNGTKVGGQPLQCNVLAPLLPGEMFQLGSVTAVVHQSQCLPHIQSSEAEAHVAFEEALERACRAAVDVRSPFAVCRIRVDSKAQGPLLERKLLAHVRGGDIVGLHSPSEFEILLRDVEKEGAERWIAALREVLGNHPSTLEIGLAVYPKQGRTAQELIARASPTAHTANDHNVDGTVIEDEQLKKLHELAHTVAKSDISVLLLGETGVGKEIFAETIHRHSRRANHPFFQLNCAALQPSLLESEMFGYEKGAFTGANAPKRGLLEAVAGGTLFLDEIGELPKGIQVKLLRVLEKREVLPVGGLRPRPINVRIVSATNRDIESDVIKGTFRKDLFFRLNGVSIEIPPLRDRTTEIEPLAKTFIAEAVRANRRGSTPVLSPGALHRLTRYSWPGNIRELRNAMEMAVLLCKGEQIGIDDLPMEKMQNALRPSVSESGEAPAQPQTEELESSTTAPVERRRIVQALERCGGNQTLAAKLLGISRPTLHARMDAFGIARPRKIDRLPPSGKSKV